jgi:metallo-beta-lactamase class B
MRRYGWQTALLVVFALAAIALPVLFRQWRASIDRNRLLQTAEPFRIADNFYYVGNNNTSAFLITAPEADAHILIGSSYPPLTLASIKRLGFSTDDVRELLASDAHDSADGMWELQHATGAHLWASTASARVIAAGGGDPDFRQPLKFFSGFGALRYPPAHVDHLVKDGDTIHVGGIVVTAHLTPGNTRGCTSWSFPVRDGDRTLNVVIACSLERVGGWRYDGQDADLERSFRVLRGLPADIWATSSSRAWGRYRKYAASVDAKNPVEAFIDPAGYRAYVDDAEDELRRDVVH